MLFVQAYELYRAGQWAEAHAVLQETKTMRKHPMTGESVVDGPSSTLLSFVEQHDCVAPQSWSGFRELTEK